ncbi:MAG: DUF748 domain-containing protein [Alistipes senegalensis]|nr:DUF748 domain-containing protein [Oxalobacter formigenes]MCM1280809.1 DUF748 domain-containing protein [Alistipes senegalensis]
MRKPDIARLKSFFLLYRRKLAVGISVFLFILFACGLSGYLFLPGVIKARAEQAVAGQLHRKLVIGEVSFNPFSLAVTLEKVSLSERDSEETFVSFDRLYVNLSTFSAFTFSPVIREVELVNPYIHLSRTTGHAYNISDLIDMAMQPAEPDSRPLSYSVNNIQVDGGVIVFDDHPMKAQHRIEDIRIRIPAVSSSPSRIETFIEPYLSARINGTRMELSGKTRPFAEDKETVFDLVLKDIALPRYMAYLPYKPAFHLAGGNLSFDLKLHFIQHEGRLPELDVSGAVELDGLRLTDLAKKPMLALDKLAVTLEKSAIFAGDFRLGQITLVRPEVYAENSASGVLNLLALAPEAKKTAGPRKPDAGKEAQDKAPMKLAVGQFAVKDGRLRYTDYAAGLPYTVMANGLNLVVDETAVDVGGRSARIGRIASDHAALEMAVEKRLQRGRAPVSSRQAVASGEPGFGVHIGEIDIGGWSVHMQNRNLKQPMGGSFTGLTAHIRDISTEPGQISALKVMANVEKKGAVRVEGRFGAAPLFADLDVNLQHVSLVALQQYIDTQVNLTLRQADVSTKGHLSLSAGKKGALQGEYKGDVSLDNLVTLDQIKGDSFVRWKTFALKQMRVQFSPFSLTARQADLDQFFARLILGADGRLNVQNILRSEAGGQKSLTDSEAPVETAGDAGAAVVSLAAASEGKTVLPPQERPEPGEAGLAAAPQAGLPPIRIDRFRLNHGRIRFTDNFIKPNYTANMDRVQGIISRIASDSRSAAAVSIKGQVNRAPLTVTGSVNPFNPALSLDLKGTVKGMELAQFSSYTSKYVGYGIEKGKLSFDVQYKVENGELSAENRLVLDQLTFGPKSEGEPVIGLPVELAVNLLKDGDGVIDVNLPVSGSLSDPDFSVGGIVFRVVVNLLKKAVTAPFSLLASAFGGGKELSWLAFAPGHAEVTEKEKEKLETLSKALKNRPGLKLEVTGCYDPEIDREGLARVSIDRKVREQKRREMGQAGENMRLSEVRVSTEEYAKLLKAVYSEADFKKPRNLIGFQKSLPVAEMEKLLVKHYPVQEEAFLRLADRRAAVAKAWLIDQGGIPEARIFLHASKRRDGGDGARVDFSLH